MRQPDPADRPPARRGQGAVRSPGAAAESRGQRPRGLAVAWLAGGPHLAAVAAVAAVAALAPWAAAAATATDGAATVATPHSGPEAAALTTYTALPPPVRTGSMALEVALQRRRSLRQFSGTPLRLAELGQLLWATQGETDAAGHRTVPSAGALYPLTVYTVAGAVAGLPAGLYRYQPAGHGLLGAARPAGDLRAAVTAAALRQGWLQQAPALLLITARPEVLQHRYRDRADRFVALEAGAAAQSLLLQAEALGLGGTLVGAVDEPALRAALGLPEGTQVLAIVPVGRPP